MSNKLKPANAGFVVRGVAAAVALACAGGAHAFQVDTGNPDLRVRFDNTVRYTLGTRIEGQDQGLMRNYVYDEGDSKFDRGDVVTNRLDLLSELDVSYRNQFGARVSAALWYDKAYDDYDVRSPAGRPTAYVNDQYNGEVKHFMNGPSGEFLDAFIWGNFEFGSVPLNVKLGRQANVWGEGLLIGAHAISYGQSPVDGVKAVTNPGIETKEVFLPLNQVHLSAQVTDSVTLVGQYFLDWKPTRVPHAGTYLMGADTAPSSDYLVYPAAFGDPAILGPFATDKAQIVDAKTPKKRGNWGVGARWNVESIESSFGLYYREFDDYTPELGVQGLEPNRAGVPQKARFLYADGVKQTSLSFSRVISGVSVGTELSYRKNGALNTRSQHGLDTGPRGDTWHAVLSGVYMLPKTGVWDTGSLTAELAYTRLDKVTKNKAEYREVGASICTNSATAGLAGLPAATPGSGSKRDGCSTDDALFMAVRLTPQYLNILPSWDLSLPMSLDYGLHGNAPSAGGGTEGELRWSVGATATYASNYEFGLRYADRSLPTRERDGVITGGAAHSNSSVGAIDRGWLSFTFKTAF